jgi:hypothetical protein
MIPDLDFFSSRILDPGVKKHRVPDLDPRHCLVQPTEEEKHGTGKSL